MARYAVRRLHDIPRIPAEEPGDPEWYPLQHYFRLTAFGANVYVASTAGGDLLAAHDEKRSGRRSSISSSPARPPSRSTARPSRRPQ